jgi:hypothetical protein
MVFEQNKGERKYEYKILQITDPAADEFNTSLANGFSVKDLFYYRGLNAILEKSIIIYDKGRKSLQTIR